MARLADLATQHAVVGGSPGPLLKRKRPSYGWNPERFHPWLTTPPTSTVT